MRCRLGDDLDGAALQLLRWARRRNESDVNMGRVSTIPAIVETIWHAERGWLVKEPCFVDLSLFEPHFSPTHDLRLHPMSPTGAAEELLDVVSSWLIQGQIDSADVDSQEGVGHPSQPPPSGQVAVDPAASQFLLAWQAVGRNADAKSKST